MNEQTARSPHRPTPQASVRAGRLPARLRHRRTLLVPPVPFTADPIARGAA